MLTLIADLKYGLRVLSKTKVLTAVAVFSLALGIGANTALYSVVEAVLLRQLPVQAPEQLVLFNWQAGKAFRMTGQRGTFVRGGYAEGMRGSSVFKASLFEAMRARQENDSSSPLAAVFGFAEFENLTFVAQERAEQVSGQMVSGNYFSSLGVMPAVGRLISEGDDKVAAAPAVVLSYAFWRDRFGADPTIVGRDIKINQASFTVIGVTPASFVSTGQVGFAPSVSLALSMEPLVNGSRALVDQPGKPAPWWVMVMGRLKPGATLAQAQASLDALFQARALELMPPPSRPDQKATLPTAEFPHLLLRPGGRGQWELRSLYAPKIYLLFGVVALVLVIACANVANLLLTRAAQRAPEITVRLAMGASRSRLIRQMLTESLVLSLIGGAFGALLAVWGKDALLALGTFGSLLPEGMSYSLNWNVLGFTVAVSMLTGLVFGIAPAWRAANLDLAPGLKDGARAVSSPARSWLGRSLVVGQVAISLVLLVGAVLFARTLLNLERTDVGFDQHNLLVFGMDPGSGGYRGDRLTQFHARAAERIEAIPGVTATTFAQMPLVSGYYYGYSLLLPGQSRAEAESHQTSLLMVRENYIDVMGIALVRGRGFTPRDTEAGLKVALINETLAAKYFGGQDPIGLRVGFDEDSPDRFEIVGVTRDIKYNRQREDKDPLVYVPWRQWSEPLTEVTFSVRTAADPVALGPMVREALRGIDSSLPLIKMTTQLVRSAESLAEERMYARLVGLFGALALLLAAIGLYGVISYSVTLRTSEIGLRMALGAQRGEVLRLVMRQAFGLVLAGATLGFLGSVALRKVVASQLWGVNASDPATLVTVLAILSSTTLIAAWIPSRRATRVDPMQALRSE